MIGESGGSHSYLGRFLWVVWQGTVINVIPNRVHSVWRGPYWGDHQAMRVDGRLYEVFDGC